MPANPEVYEPGVAHRTRLTSSDCTTCKVKAGPSQPTPFRAGMRHQARELVQRAWKWTKPQLEPSACSCCQGDGRASLESSPGPSSRLMDDRAASLVRVPDAPEP